MISLRRCRELVVRYVLLFPWPPIFIPLKHTILTRHIRFVGPGLVSSVAYIDPGDWATDLQAGASYGYKLLFIVLLSGLAAVGTCPRSWQIPPFLERYLLVPLIPRQYFSSSRSVWARSHPPRSLRRRVSCLSVSRRNIRDIASHSDAASTHYTDWRKRRSSGRTSRSYLVRPSRSTCTSLSFRSKDLQGSLRLTEPGSLFPRLPLYAGVLITATDVLLVLVFFRSNSGRQGMLLFEVVIVSLVRLHR